MLKVLEEPNKGVFFILIHNNSKKIKDTITSRCINFKLNLSFNEMNKISSSLIKDLGEHPEDKKHVRIMKGQYGTYIKYKSLNATIREEKDPNELTMEEALILIEKRKEYDKSKKRKK